MNFKLTPRIVYIGIGSNMQNPLEQCREAIKLIADSPELKLTRCSSFYKTEPVGIADQDWFINAVVSAETTLSPSDLLSSLLRIETEMGRARKIKWGPRVIDLDLLFYDDNILEYPGLKVPHPEIQYRRFILAPMSEIAGEFKHPGLKKTISELLAELPPTPIASRIQDSS